MGPDQSSTLTAKFKNNNEYNSMCVRK